MTMRSASRVARLGQPGQRQELDIEVRVLLQQAPEPRREDQRAEALRRSDPHGAADALSLAGRLLAQQRDAVLDRFRVGNEVPAGLGQHVARGRALEQPAAERALELVDAPGDRRVVDAEPAPDAGQALLPDELEEVAQVVPGRAVRGNVHRHCA